MSDENRITDRESYLKYFTENSNSININSIQYLALKNALDIRKFEIELYWKRAAYFWTFIAACFAGYFVLVTKVPKADDKMPLLIVCILGFVFSYSWYFVNRGSKYWQNNWERHVDYLEDEIMGPLYRIYRNPEECNFFNPLSEYPISVSKINQVLSLFVSSIWFYLTYDAISRFGKFSLPVILHFELIGVIVMTFIYGKWCKSKIKDDKTNTNKEEIFIIRNFE